MILVSLCAETIKPVSSDIYIYIFYNIYIYALVKRLTRSSLFEELNRTGTLSVYPTSATPTALCRGMKYSREDNGGTYRSVKGGKKPAYS